MPQITLSVPTEKLPVLKDLLHALGLAKNTKSSTTGSDLSGQHLTDSANTFFRKHFSWEYYQNELEFE